MFRGRVTGERQRVTAILIYGPNSIIREQARVAPGADRAWWGPLPPAGSYRVVPIGEGSRPLRTRPNFRTVVVKPGEAREGIDFVVERSP